MLNPSSANEELNARLLDVLLKIKLSGICNDGEMAALCYATGISIDWSPRESRLERLQRMAREAAEWRKQQDIEQATLRG